MILIEIGKKFRYEKADNRTGKRKVYFKKRYLTLFHIHLAIPISRNECKVSIR